MSESADAAADVRLAGAIAYARRLFACNVSDGAARVLVAKAYRLDGWDSALAITLAGIEYEAERRGAT